MRNNGDYLYTGHSDMTGLFRAVQQPLFTEMPPVHIIGLARRTAASMTLVFLADSSSWPYLDVGLGSPSSQDSCKLIVTMSLPNHVFATTKPSETLQKTLEPREMTLDWPSSASITPDFPSHRAQAQNISVSNSQYPQTATGLQRPQQEYATEMDLHTINYATGNEDYLKYSVASQSESDFLDTWIPNFHRESSINTTGTINQGQYGIEQILPWSNALCEEICDFDSLIPIQFPQTQLVESQESREQSLDEHQASRYAFFASTSSGESLETIKDHNQTMESTNVTKRYLVDDVLRTLRQMDYQIRAMHRKDMADIVCSSTI
ncbi:hypothetical protein GGI35DRAFT_182553 [Trichoderma velutinum]